MPKTSRIFIMHAIGQLRLGHVLQRSCRGDVSVLSDDVFDAGDHGRSAFGKPAWFERVRAEYWACREGVCLIDMSTFTKFELSVSLTAVTRDYVCALLLCHSSSYCTSDA